MGEVGHGHQESVHGRFQLGDIRVEGGDFVCLLYTSLLSAVRELASDLTFPMGGIGCPSVDVGELSVSGT